MQTQLNCERLSSAESPVSLELRWSVTTDADSDTPDAPVLLLQLVSSTGSERYLALGIKAEEDDVGDIGGDVVVGWINSRTGKGGVDDYFLAAADGASGETCQDGAESCPDTGKVFHVRSSIDALIHALRQHLITHRAAARTWSCLTRCRATTTRC